MKAIYQHVFMKTKFSKSPYLMVPCYP